MYIVLNTEGESIRLKMHRTNYKVGGWRPKLSERGEKDRSRARLDNSREKKKSGLCTSAGVFVPPSKWVAGVVSRHDDIPKANMKREGRITGALLDFTGGMYIHVMYIWHSEGMSTRNERLLCTLWKSMSGARYSWIIGCDA